MAYSPYGRYFWQPQGTIASSSNSTALNIPNTPIDIHDATDLWLAAFAPGNPTGTNPTLTVQLDVFDGFGNLFPAVLALTQLTGSTLKAHGSIGVHVQGGTSLVLPAQCQVSWTIGGTAGPTWPGLCISLLGR
ncbi:MAG TPA: hypothetical protein VLT58_11415 [Polyangia bacterium]|nr:hypothetical protein [Polyangia bacterium]